MMDMEWWRILGIIICFGVPMIAFWYSEEGEEF